MRNGMVRGEKYQGKLQVGQRIHSILYGGRDGIIYAIHGEQRPETIRSLGGGMVTGGTGRMDIVFHGYGAHISRMLPECIIRGVQWYIGEEIADQAEIDEAIRAAEAKAEADKQQAKEEADQRANTREMLPGKYPYLIPLAKAPKNSSYALGAKNIKIELAMAFPGIKFSAKSESYSGGDSIHVSWTDGPMESEVDKIIKGYQEGHFNGMDDIYEHDHGNVWPDVFGGAKFVSGSRHESRALRLRAAGELGYSTLTDSNFDQWDNLAGLDRETEQMIYRKAREIRGEVGQANPVQPAQPAQPAPVTRSRNAVLDAILAD